MKLAAVAGLTLPLAAYGVESSAESAASGAGAPSASQTASDAKTVDNSWQFYGQATYVDQYHPAFSAAYSGAYSLDPASSNNETADITLFAGHRLWNGAEFWINPEIDQGFGLSNTLGIAGFSSGEAYKIGANAPYLRVPRAFVRQVFNLGGEAQNVEAGVNQVAGTTNANNVTLTVGKFSVVDIFDTNTYAHDPRSDFLNWSLVDGGSFDYAADSWGFTNGLAVEWNQGSWTLRGGAFQMSEVPNSKVSGLHLHQYELVTELEERHQWLDHPGKLKLLTFVNRGDMANYTDAVQWGLVNAATPDVSQVRKFSSNPGMVLNFEQEITSDLGIFARASANSGKKEAYEFTDINRSLSAGFTLQGNGWGRANDKLGLAGVVNALSGDARTYFADGGLGILIGDGALNYGREQIVEAFYSAQLCDKVKLTADYQRVVNPGYNQDRGPVSVYALRLHAEY
ncbi:MAG: carbohydrate porin [Burkholderiaceae bacterium]|nr:carbohydrate porin [Burkholderiaceae bacterium]